MGTLKAGTFVWKDMDLKLFSPDLLEKLDDASQKPYPTTPWRDRTTDVGLTIARVKNYNVYFYPEEEYGHFYSSDIYIILSGRHVSSLDKISWDIHLWVGRYSSPEDYEAGIAKVVELDEEVNHEGVLHREIQGYESELFKSYFNPWTIWKGSYDDSYRANKGETYQARMLNFFKPDIRKNNYRVKEVPTERRKLDQSNVFIMDVGEELYMWIGSAAVLEIRNCALRYTEKLRADRGLETKVQIFEELHASSDHPFFIYLRGGNKQARGGDKAAKEALMKETMTKFKGRGNTGYSLKSIKTKKNKTSFEEKKPKNLEIDLNKNNASLLETETDLFIVVGSKAAVDEKKYGLEYAHTYLKQDHPGISALKPVTVIRYGAHSATLQRAMES